MSDLSTRLVEGLAGAAGRAPGPGDLASGARSRLRRRRRTTAGVVAAALAVVVVPVGVTGLVTDDSPDRRAPSPTSDATTAWRTETWRDLSLRVPQEWGWGGGRGWCADGAELGGTSRVSRPSGPVPAIVCTPSYGYGAHFQRPTVGELPPGTEGAVQQYRGGRYPDGSWIGYVSTQHSAVWVVAEDRTTARLVLDSATPVGEVDSHGCASRLEMGAPATGDRVSVCRYDAAGWLEQGELLSEADSRAAVAAVAAAPQSAPSARRCTWEQQLERPAITLSSSGFSATVLLEGCRVVDPAGGVVPRKLTEDVLYWSLSPGAPGATRAQ